MINNFISGLVAIFIWGKTGSKTLEKILAASWPRTFVYGFLSFIVFILLCKTYQVATVYNMVQIAGFKQACDSSGNVVDTVKNVVIAHKLAAHSMQQGNFEDQGIKIYTNDKKKDEEFSRYGGAFFKVEANAHPYAFKKRKIKGMDEGDWLSLDIDLDKHGIPHKKVNQLYELSFLATNIPSFIPFYPKVEERQRLMSNDTTFYDREKANTRGYKSLKLEDEYSRATSTSVGDISDAPTELPDIFNNGFVFKGHAGTISVENPEFDAIELGIVATCRFVNSLDFFTAADISQYTYTLTLNSDCPVEDMTIEFDIPIEMTQYDEHMKVGPRGFVLDKEMVELLQRQPSIGFNIKFPSLANLQLIRSLILTTLLTALVSLFFRNLFFRVRKWAYDKRKKYWIPYRTARQLSPTTRKKIKCGKKKFKKVLCFLLTCLFVAIGASTWIVWDNSSILFPADLFILIYFIPLAYLLLSAIIIYFSYKNVRKPLLLALSGKEEQVEGNGDDAPPSIFLHERDENEEYDRLVEEQLRESADAPEE